MPETGERKQIQGLPQGWIWDYSSGPWKDAFGHTGRGRHAVNYLSGEMMNVKSVRNVQRTQQGLPATPKAKGTQREGLLYTKQATHRYRGKPFRTVSEL